MTTATVTNGQPIVINLVQGGGSQVRSKPRKSDAEQWNEVCVPIYVREVVNKTTGEIRDNGAVLLRVCKASGGPATIRYAYEGIRQDGSAWFGAASYFPPREDAIAILDGHDLVDRLNGALASLGTNILGLDQRITTAEQLSELIEKLEQAAAHQASR